MLLAVFVVCCMLCLLFVACCFLFVACCLLLAVGLLSVVVC